MREIKIKLRTRQSYEGESCSLDGCIFFNHEKDVCKLYDEEDLLRKRKCASPPSWCEVRKHKVIEVKTEDECLIRIKME